MFFKKVAKFDKIFTVDLTLTTYSQIDGEDFVNFCGLLRKHELYNVHNYSKPFEGVFSVLNKNKIIMIHKIYLNSFIF